MYQYTDKAYYSASAKHTYIGMGQQRKHMYQYTDKPYYSASAKHTHIGMG